MGLRLSVVQDLLLAFCSLPFACSSVTLHRSGHGCIFPLLFLCCCFTLLLSRLAPASPSNVVTAGFPGHRCENLPFPLAFFLPMDCSFRFRGAFNRPAQSAHLEPPYCISSRLQAELSLSPPSFSPLISIFPKSNFHA